MFRFMRRVFVFKTYHVRGSPESALDALSRVLITNGMIRTGMPESGGKVTFRHPSIFFSSRHPLSYISELSLEARGRGGEAELRVGASFTKMKTYIIIAMGFVWIGLPIAYGLLNATFPEFSPFGVLVVPTGILLHYSFRGSAFRRLRRLIQNPGDTHGIR